MFSSYVIFVYCLVSECLSVNNDFRIFSITLFYIRLEVLREHRPQPKQLFIYLR